jgi:hypothetical protein
MPCPRNGQGGRSTVFGSKCAGVTVLYNEEDLKENSPGMTAEMRNLLRSSGCLKVQLATYFGYQYSPTFDWCCSSRECLSLANKESRR